MLFIRLLVTLPQFFCFFPLYKQPKIFTNFTKSQMDLIFLLTLSSLLLVSSSATQTYIVQVQNNLKPSKFSLLEDWYRSTLFSLDSYDTTTETEKTIDFIYVYKTAFHGFSAQLTPEQAMELSQREEILGVLPDRVHQVDTTRSGRFMGLERNNPTGLETESDWGSNVIIGMFDTGIWPERSSFHDKGLGEVGPRWRGECVEGERFKKEHCNNKIIGARYFINGYEVGMDRFNKTTDMRSPRDNDGHGTHTASTAAGRAVPNASFFGFASGQAVGIAPKARLAVYKICWRRGCMESDILAAFDAAVEDGVDVISLSVGGTIATPFTSDPISIGAFTAAQHGIFVSTSAGNSGPMVGSVTNVAPWMTSVGAGTIDRSFPVDLVLGDGNIIVGASVYTGKPLNKNTFFPIVYAGDVMKRDNVEAFGGSFAATCLPGSLDENLVHGKIVVCDRGAFPRVAKGLTVRDAGGVGVVVENIHPLGEGLIADPHLIPGLSITELSGYKLRAYINGSKDPKATMIFHGTHTGVKPAPVVASFSSRGPNSVSVYALKPDVIAPGVNILAAWPDEVSPSDLSSDPRRTEFNILSGTSMSCPHVSGIAALLKGAHPDWSPAMIRSALITTAYTRDHKGDRLLDEADYKVSSVWGTGAGHVDPNRAVDPGLVYDLTVDDYINFLCAIGYLPKDISRIAHKPVSCDDKRQQPSDLNYPALSYGVEITPKNGSTNEMVFRRTVTYVGEGVGSYSVSAVPPKGVEVSVEPVRLDFKEKGEKASFLVRLWSESKPPGDGSDTVSGELTWTDGKHRVTSPIAVLYTGPHGPH